MITISTGGIGPMDIVANTKAKGASKEEEKAVDAFASLMNMVSSNQEQEGVLPAEDVDVSEVAPAKDVAKDYETYSKQEQVEVSEDKFKDTEKSQVKEDTQAADVKTTDSEVEKEDSLVDQAVALIKEVKATLKDALNLTDEELEGLLADMGIDASQLLIGDNLKNFILQFKGATTVDLLVNEDLANLVADITNEVSQIIQNYNSIDGIDFQQFVADNAETVEFALQDNVKDADIIVDDAISVNADKTPVVEENNQVDVAEVDYEESKSDTKILDNKVESNIGDDGLAGKVKVTNTSESGQSMTQDKSSQQSNQQIVANFNQAIDNTVNTNVTVDATTFVDQVQEADIIRQIIDQIKVNAGKEIQSMEVQLNPENLGKVYVNVEAKDGVMQAKIVAETEAAKNAIENNLAILKENFSTSELKVEAIEVMVAAYGFFEGNQSGDFNNEEQTNDTSKAIGGVNVNALDEEELTDEEVLEVEIMKSKGNTVSYTV